MSLSGYSRLSTCIQRRAGKAKSFGWNRRRLGPIDAFVLANMRKTCGPCVKSKVDCCNTKPTPNEDTTTVTFGELTVQGLAATTRNVSALPCRTPKGTLAFLGGVAGTTSRYANCPHGRGKIVADRRAGMVTFDPALTSIGIGLSVATSMLSPVVRVNVIGSVTNTEAEFVEFTSSFGAEINR